MAKWGMTSALAVATSMIDQLRNCVAEVQEEAGGSLEDILAMRNSIHAAREGTSGPSERALNNAAYMILTVAESREFEAQSAIAPVSKLVATGWLTSRISQVLHAFVEGIDGSPQMLESAVDALLEIDQGLDPKDPHDRQTNLLIAAALLIAGEARRGLDQ
jgi:hypothetical protein